MEREIRYTVLKHADLNRFLSPADQHALARIESIITASREAEGRGELKAVVVEHDWSEYEPVWKMLEARINLSNQIKQIDMNGGVLIMARRIAQACIQDAHEEGYDIEAGLFGPHLSKELVEVNKWRKKSELFDMIRTLMGYVENGSDDILTMFQDDATRQYFVRLGRDPRNEVFGHSIENVIAKAYEMYAEKPDETN